jgi:hypothetical protein
MAEAVPGIDVVLRRLANAGCQPEPMGTGSWYARCPLHDSGGHYWPLVIFCYADGSVSLRCRERNRQGESCSEAAIWKSLGLERKEFKPGGAKIGPPPDANGRGAPPLDAADGQTSGPLLPGAAQEPESPSASDHGAAPLWLQQASSPEVGGEFAVMVFGSSEAQPGIAGGPAVGDLQNSDVPEPAVAVQHPAGSCSSPQEGGIVESREPNCRSGLIAPENTVGSRKAHARTLKRLAREVRVIRGLDDQLYGQVPVAGHLEVHELKSPALRYWLIRGYRRWRKTVPARDCWSALISALEADAAALETAENVSLRVAAGTGDGAPGAQGQPGRDAVSFDRMGWRAADGCYLDLGDSSWQCVEIRPEGCRVIAQPPVYFRRPRGFRPLPVPEWRGSIDLLRKYLNVAEADFPLVIGWITAAYLPAGPYPILGLIGEYASAKSTMTRVLSELIDPSSLPLKLLPSSQRDFAVQSYNRWLLAYDNVSSLPEALADGLCLAATGGGYSTRSLYSDRSEALFDAQRPAIINGIDEILHRPDVIDRCLIVRPPPIPDEARRLTREFWAEFRADRPVLLGAILTAVSGGLRMLPDVKLSALPRMADFARWGEAVMRGLGWAPGAFLDRYYHNRRAAVNAVLQSVDVAQALCGVIDSAGGTWRGTASELLDVLPRHTEPGATKNARWPKTPSHLSVAIRRILPQLRTIAITVEFEIIDKTRIMTISRINHRGDGAARINGHPTHE